MFYFANHTIKLSKSQSAVRVLILFTYILVKADYVEHQKKVLSFFAYPGQVYTEAEWYKIGKDYDIQANIDNYTVRILNVFCGNNIV